MILSTLLNQTAFTKAFSYQGVHQKGRTQIYSFLGKPPAPQKLSIQVEKRSYIKPAYSVGFSFRGGVLSF